MDVFYQSERELKSESRGYIPMNNQRVNEAAKHLFGDFDDHIAVDAGDIVRKSYVVICISMTLFRPGFMIRSQPSLLVTNSSIARSHH